MEKRISTLFKTEYKNELEIIYSTNDNEIFFSKNEAHNYCEIILKEGNIQDYHNIKMWFKKDYINV